MGSLSGPPRPEQGRRRGLAVRTIINYVRNKVGWQDGDAGPLEIALPDRNHPWSSAPMRWIWIDRFLEFTPGVSATAVKNVSLAEEHLHDHWEDFPVMPVSLMIEGMAQTSGILVGQARDFREKVILAKISKAEIHEPVTPGDQLKYHTELVAITGQAASTHGTVLKNDKPIGVIDLMFSHIDQNQAGLKFPKENFVFTGQFMRLLAGFVDTPGANADAPSEKLDTPGANSDRTSPETSPEASSQ